MSELCQVQWVLDGFSSLNQFGKLVVAGGAVRDQLMARTPKDFDLFILTNDKWNDGVAEAVKRITADYPDVKAEVEWHKSEPYLIRSLSFKSHEIQLMQSPFGSTDALLDSFDWNVCRFAFDGSFHTRELVENIGVGKELKLHKVTNPLSTLRRGFRFSERFLMRLRIEDVKLLCSKISKPTPRADLKEELI